MVGCTRALITRLLHTARTQFDATRKDELDVHIDAYAAHCTPLKTFILAGGGECGASLHIARTVCRYVRVHVFTPELLMQSS